MTRWADRLVRGATLLVCTAPLFLFTVNRWPNGVLFVGAALAIAALLWGRLPPADHSPSVRRWLVALVVVLVAPLASAVAAALLRGDFLLPQFDAPSRLLLAIPILLFVARARADAASRLTWVIPLSLLLTLGYHLVVGQPARWPAQRMTTSFVDPLVFGYVSLALSLMCFASIGPEDFRRGASWSLLLRVVGGLLGLYLSVRSGSRTGWAAAPIVLAVWLQLHAGRRHWIRGLIGMLLALVAAAAIYLLAPVFHHRVDIAIKQAAGYNWQGVAQDNAVALRITYLRIGADLLGQHFWTGIGDFRKAAGAYANSFGYASAFAVRSAFESAFHNQMMTNAVRSGIGGLLATAGLLLVPLAACCRGLAAADGSWRRNAMMGFAFFTTLFVSSLSTEVVDLKYMASFVGVMIAVLCGATLAEAGSAPRPVNAS